MKTKIKTAKPKAKPAKKAKPAAGKFLAGASATMLFHGFGLVSEAKHTISEVKANGTVVLDTDEDPRKCFGFDPATGRCLNDKTDFGCHRTLKL
jgi:hypothetical protein